MGVLKNIGKKLLNPLTPLNVVGKVADKIADATGIGDNLGNSTIGKIANYALNPVAQAQGIRDSGEPVTEWAEKNPDKVKLIGNVVQVVGAGVALVFPPAGAIVSAVGTGIVYASKAIETKNTISSLSDMAKGVKTAIQNKDWKLALLTISYLATQGENITADLRTLKLSLTNDGKLAQYQNTLSQLAALSGNSAATIEKANAIYTTLLNEFQSNSGQNKVTVKEIQQNENGDYIAVEIAENQPLIVRFLKWFFGI